MTDAALSSVSYVVGDDRVDTHEDAPGQARIVTPTFSVVIPTYNEERDISDTLDRVLAQRLAPYKSPRSYLLVDHPVRDDAGKVRKSMLIEQRGNP